LFLDRHLVATPDDLDLELYFPMGPHDASVTIPHAELNEFNGVLRVLREELAAGHRREAVVKAFLEAVRTWLDSNPSDLGYFLVSHRTAKRPRLRDLFNRGELGAVQGGKEAVSPSVSISSAITI